MLTFTLVELPPLPVSSSVTVTPTVYTSDGVPDGLSSRYWWLALKVRTPAARLSVVPPSLGPQLITTVCVSSVPGSVNDPLRVKMSFSLIVPVFNATPVGATLFTVTLVPALTEPVSSSVIVTAIG